MCVLLRWLVQAWQRLDLLHYLPCVSPSMNQKCRRRAEPYCITRFWQKATEEAIQYARAMKTFGTSTLDNLTLVRDGVTALVTFTMHNGLHLRWQR